MKKAVKILSITLALILAVAAFAGCGKEETVKEKGKYTYWVPLDANSAQTVSSFDELLMYQELEKRTGVEVEFIHPSKGSTGGEAFQILLTSTNMPDMIEYDWSAYPGGPDKAIENKVIISINKYMKDCAPNYYSYMEGDRAADNGYRYKVESITQNGNYYGFKNMNFGSRRCFNGFIVRKDMLDKWGLEVPVTIDDWDNVLKTAKENGIKKPLTGSNALFAVDGSERFNVAWNVGKDFHLEDDKVIFALEKPEYKEYVAHMADWFKKGYIDPDYITNESEVIKANMTNGTSIAVNGFIGGMMGTLLPAMAEKDPNYNVVACPVPVLKEGDIPWSHVIQGESLEPTIAITYNCGVKDEERYKEAMKWCDYHYSDEGTVLKCFGVKGKTFNEVKREDGTVGYDYLITSPEEMEKIGAHSVEAALWHYGRPANAPGFNQHDDYLRGFYPYQQQIDAIQLWNIEENIENARKHNLPTLSYTDEEATKMAELKNKCVDKLDTAISKIICNEAGIDTFDAAVKTAKKDGYDELKKIYQAAYDRYVANLK